MTSCSKNLVKRGVSLKGLTYGAVEPAAEAQTGKDYDAARDPNRKGARDRKADQRFQKKAQASIQGDLVRVSGKDRDTLQEIIALLKQKDFGIDYAVHQLSNELSTVETQLRTTLHAGLPDNGHESDWTSAGRDFL